MRIINIFKNPADEMFDLTDFKINKISHHSRLLFITLLVSVIFEMCYFISDYLEVGAITPKALIPRFIIIIPYFLWVMTYRNVDFTNVKQSRACMILAYIVAHLTSICIIWANTLLPNVHFKGESFIIMQFMFLCLGLCSIDAVISTIAHLSFFIEVFVANMIQPFDNFMLICFYMISLTITIWIVCHNHNKSCIENYLNEVKLEYLSTHDAQTDVYIRSYMNNIEDVAKNSKFMSYGLLVVAIDDYSDIYNKCGHTMCDNLMTKVATLLKSQTRFTKTVHQVNDKTIDYIFRWSIDEFVIVFPEVTKEELTMISERIRSHIENDNTGILDSITISGGAVMSVGSERYDSAIKRASALLLSSMNDGKNQILIG